MLYLRCENLGSRLLNFTVASYFYCKTNRWLSTLLRQITPDGSTAVSTAILKLYTRRYPGLPGVTAGLPRGNRGSRGVPGVTLGYHGFPGVHGGTLG